MYIKQKQLENLNKLVASGKVVVVYGPRRCGKTTLINKFLEKEKDEFLLVSGEDITVQEELSSQSIERLKNFIGKNKLLAVDEAQKIKNIGLNLKLIVDHIPKVKLIATGSSAFDLAQNIGEPLTGRKYTLKLFPLAQSEINEIESTLQTKSNLENRLIYGSYPEVITSQGNQEKARYLKELIASYLYKDILELEGLRHSHKIVRLLQLLAFQIGNKVSFNELAGQIGMSKNTAEKYLDLLEKSFVIYKMMGFSRNLRKEISKNPRYYFYDNGIRNALINNLNPLSMRDDIGKLWENYIMIERMKKKEYLNISSSDYFWRTYTQQEIDLIEERSGALYAYEIKWNIKVPKVPKEWRENYKKSEFQVINKENYLNFIS